MKTKAEVTLDYLSDWYELDEMWAYEDYKQGKSATANYHAGRASLLIHLIEDLFGGEAARAIQKHRDVNNPIAQHRVIGGR